MIDLTLASDELDLFCYHANLVGVLSSDQEDNIPLAGVDVVILQEEWLINAILLKSAELDDKTDCARQRFFQY
jgi:hypothetical protein